MAVSSPQPTRNLKQFVPLKLRDNFSWNVFGNVLYTLCQWGILVILAKLGNAEMVGQFTLGLALVSPLMLFTGLQLRAVQATDAKNEYQFGDYLSLRLLGIFAALTLIVGVVIVAPYPLVMKGVILGIAIAKALESLSDIFHGFFQHCERMDRIAVSLVLKGSLSLVALMIGLSLTRNLWGGILGLGLAWGGVLVFYDLPVAQLLMRYGAYAPDAAAPDPLHPLQPSWRWKVLWNLLKLTFPLGIVILLISLNINIPRYFIEHHLGTQALGVFAAMAYIPLAGNMVIGALGQSASPRLAKHYTTGKRGPFCRLLLQLLGVGAGIGLTGVILAHVFGKAILTILYRAEFAEQSQIFVLLIIAASCGYLSSLLGYSLTAIRQLKVQAPLFLSITALSALLCFYLIPGQGLWGAAMALIVANLVQLVISAGMVIHTVMRMPSP